MPAGGGHVVGDCAATGHAASARNRGRIRGVIAISLRWVKGKEPATAATRVVSSLLGSSPLASDAARVCQRVLRGDPRERPALRSLSKTRARTRRSPLGSPISGSPSSCPNPTGLTSFAPMGDLVRRRRSRLSHLLHTHGVTAARALLVLLSHR